MKNIIASLFFGLLLVSGNAQSFTADLTKNWKFYHQRTAKWYSAEVPGTIHTDLLTHNLIPDPFYRDNEKQVQWVEKQTWKYRLVFDLTQKQFLQKHIELVFDGLDTYANIYLNGKKILNADNMFHEWRINVRQIVKKTGNQLVIEFLPATELAKKKKKSSLLKYPDNERVFVRKAQYQFGWDWGPRLVTCGIWKNVRITGYDQKTIEKPAGSLNAWNLKLVTEKDSIGESFLFTKNGKPVYIKGSNWIPADNFLPRAKKLERYETLIRAAKEANINMLRVWGGGVYEDDVFYDLCDKYGIMVWQDFMFAGAMYPAGAAQLKSIEREVRYQVKRLRHHPSIALWCGNNEIEEAWFNWGWQKQFGYSPSDSMKLWNDYKKIFHELIPSIVKELDPTRSYWPSSPSLGWGRDSAYKKGDVHYWGVWWGKEPVEKYMEKVGRFNSEYGMQGMPDMKTIMQFALPEDLDTTSAVMKNHQKHPFGYANIKMYIENKFRTPKTFEDLVYVSQLMQADAIRTAIIAHRSDPKNSGTLFWQWNDCWPVVSWSAVDHYGRKKALYYEVKRSFADSVLSVVLTENGFVIGVISKASDSNHLISSVQVVPFDNTDTSLRSWRVASPKPGQFAFLPFSGLQKPGLDSVTIINNYFIKYTIHGKDYPTVTAGFLMSDPKNIDLPRPNISWEKSALFDDVLELSTDIFAYGVFIDVPDGVELDDNYFNLLPGETKQVKFTSKIPLETFKDSIKIRSLADTYTK